MTEKGQDQARQVRAYFEKHDMTFDQYYCTTTERASDTIELATGQTDYQRVKGLKEMKCTSVFLRVNRSIFIPRHLLRGILGTTMPSLVGKVKISL
nr:histidine phosphatase family protein [Streptococcus thermophilus]